MKELRYTLLTDKKELIIHYGLPSISSTNFIIFDKKMAKQFIKELTKYVNQ